MNAQKIYTYMKEINLTGISLHKDITPECVEPFHKLFDTMRVLEPVDLWRQGEDRFLWIKAPRGSYEEFCESHRSNYTYYVNRNIWEESTEPDWEKMEKDWPVLYPEEEVWYGLKLMEHKGNRAISLNKTMLAEVPADKKDWRDYHKYCRGEMDIRPLLTWMQEEAERCIAMLQAGTYMDYVRKNLPFYGREGFISCKKYWEFVPEDFERTYGKVDPKVLEEFTDWVDRCAGKEEGLSSYTSGDYFWACRQYYEVVGRLKDDDGDKTDRELYIRYSDGRDGRLRELSVDSPEEFAEWFHKGYYEHHVWELDYAHKWLRVRENNGKYSLSLFYDLDQDTAELLPVVLQLVKRGVPISADYYTNLASSLRGEGFVRICSGLCDFDHWKDPMERPEEKMEDISITERRSLPNLVPENLAAAITWSEIPQVKLYI